MVSESVAPQATCISCWDTEHVAVRIVKEGLPRENASYNNVQGSAIFSKHKKGAGAISPTWMTTSDFLDGLACLTKRAFHPLGRNYYSNVCINKASYTCMRAKTKRRLNMHYHHWLV